jgi:hypothetical protein
MCRDVPLKLLPGSYEEFFVLFVLRKDTDPGLRILKEARAKYSELQ